MKSTTLNVLDIYLDNDNPRHDPIENRSEIIKYLVKNEKVKALASHICKNGINPLDRIAVAKNDKGNFVALEGNRRICALTLLNDPNLSPEEDRSYFKNLSQNSKKYPTQIDCVLFDQKNDANVWIELRHNGEQNGVGLLTWNTIQKTRHFGSSDNTLALKLLDYAEQRNYLSKESRTGLITTASRFLGNPIFRTTLGICSKRSDPNVTLEVDRQEFDFVLKKFINDLKSGTNSVTSRSKKDDWEHYAKILKSSGLAPQHYTERYALFDVTQSPEGSTSAPTSSAPTSSAPTSSAPTSSAPTSSAPTSSAPTSTNNNQSPNTRKYIIPSDFKVNIPDKILKRIFDELRSIDCNTHPLASSIVCRVFLENIYSLMYEKLYGKYPDGLQEHIVMEKIIIKLNNHKANMDKSQKRALEAFKRVQSNSNDALSPKTLGANAHGGIYPDSKALKITWDNISSILLFMINKIFDRAPIQN